MVYTPKYTNATSIYKKSGLTSSDCDVEANDYQLIKEAEAELEAFAGRNFSATTTVTEYQSGPKKDVLGYSGKKARTLRVENYPILSVTALQFLNVDGSLNTDFATLSTVEISAGTFINADYVLERQEDPITQTQICNGKISFLTEEIPYGDNNVKITYTYGYATVPTLVAQLAAAMGALKQWETFMGVNYNFIQSYSIPQQSVNKGDFSGRAKAKMETLQAEIDRLKARIGQRPQRMFFASGSDR